MKEKLYSDGKSKIKNFARRSLVSILAATTAFAPTLIFNSCKCKPTFDYTTTITPVTSEYIEADQGGEVNSYGMDELINAKLTIPSGALLQDTIVELGITNNPTVLPEFADNTLNYIGAPVNIEPDGTELNEPVTIEISYTDEELSDAGISNESELSLYGYSPSINSWEEVPIKSRNFEENLITTDINHFSYYAITGKIGIPDTNIGVPQTGNLLYKTGSVFNDSSEGWSPGHVGMYVGEKDYPRECYNELKDEPECLASDDVKIFAKYNVIEPLKYGVQYSYYNLPGVTESFEEELDSFEGNDVYMGAREPKTGSLTEQQREDAVAFAELQVGKPYAWKQTGGVLFGLLSGQFVKGPSFNCVGLAEAAYEYAGVNNGKGLVDFIHETGLLTPAEQYNQTRPAGCNDPIDTDCDECIDNYELTVNVFPAWKRGEISISELLNYINNWKTCDGNDEKFIYGEWDETFDYDCDGTIDETNKLVFHEDHTFESERCNGYEGAWEFFPDENRIKFTFDGCDYPEYTGKAGLVSNGWEGTYGLMIGDKIEEDNVCWEAKRMIVEF